MIDLSRAYLPDGSGTFGLWTVEGEKFHILEPPWKANARSESCIPEGVYTLRKRPSPIVERTSRGEFTEGWEVTGIAGRDLIMVHVGNWTMDTDGCLLVGERFAWDTQHGPMVPNSLRTFRDFMKALSSRDEWNIHIHANLPEWP